jgi:hypothetical protein
MPHALSTLSRATSEHARTPRSRLARACVRGRLSAGLALGSSTYRRRTPALRGHFRFRRASFFDFSLFRLGFGDGRFRTDRQRAPRRVSRTQYAHSHSQSHDRVTAATAHSRRLADASTSAAHRYVRDTISEDNYPRHPGRTRLRTARSHGRSHGTNDSQSHTERHTNS